MQTATQVFRLTATQSPNSSPWLPSLIYGVRSINFYNSTVLAADIQRAQSITEIRKELALQITMRLMALGRQARY